MDTQSHAELSSLIFKGYYFTLSQTPHNTNR